MKQLLQYQKTGELQLGEVPSPPLRDGFVLVRTAFSAISAGTERTSVSTAQASLIRKARSRPDLVRQVMDNMRREGILATLRKVQSRLESMKALGYSASGVVLESRSDLFKPGDRVACAGGGYASHAEIICVPQNLCVHLPSEVPLDHAALVTLGAIALQGIRQGGVEAGAAVAVIGLGLLGQLSLLILRAMGCRAVGLDISDAAVAAGTGLGFPCLRSDTEDAAARVASLTGGAGADAVIITAGTSSNAPVELAGAIARDRGTVVIVGAVKADIPRSPYYEKELTVRLSRSYGPGRYDPAYEEYGLDYPIGYVRWTEQRNMETIVAMMAAGSLPLDAIITHRFPIDDAVAAYDLVTGKRKEPYLGILLRYGGEAAASATLPAGAWAKKEGAVNVGFIGAGNFAQSYLLPPLRGDAGVQLKTVVTIDGVEARSVARKFGFAAMSTDPEAVLGDPAVGLVVVATRHDAHAEYVIRALRAGKPVFVEKPLAIDEAQLEAISRAREETGGRVMVGFNRRFSRPVERIREFFAGRKEPLAMIYRANAGFIPSSSWVQDPAQGGRIVGEACHFVDVMQYLTGAAPVRVSAACHAPANRSIPDADVSSILISFDDGSIGTIHYFAKGDPSVEKEYLEVYGENRTAILHNFTRVECSTQRKKQVHRFDGSKGHAEEILAAAAAAREGRDFPIPFESLARTTRVTFAALESIRTGAPVVL